MFYSIIYLLSLCACVCVFFQIYFVCIKFRARVSVGRGIPKKIFITRTLCIPTVKPGSALVAARFNIINSREWTLHFHIQRGLRGWVLHNLAACKWYIFVKHTSLIITSGDIYISLNSFRESSTVNWRIISFVFALFCFYFAFLLWFVLFLMYSLRFWNIFVCRS